MFLHARAMGRPNLASSCSSQIMCPEKCTAKIFTNPWQMEYEATGQQPQSDGRWLLKAHCCSHPAKQPVWILWRMACYRQVPEKQTHKTIGLASPEGGGSGMLPTFKLFFPRYAKRLVCRVFVCFLFFPGKTLVLGETTSKSRFWIT